MKGPLTRFRRAGASTRSAGHGHDEPEHTAVERAAPPRGGKRARAGRALAEIAQRRANDRAGEDDKNTAQDWIHGNLVLCLEFHLAPPVDHARGIHPAQPPQNEGRRTKPGEGRLDQIHADPHNEKQGENL